MNFTHLHVHSHYSLLDGLVKIKPLVKTAKERGFSALALTDNGSMYGAIEFYKVCQAEGIKPIIGFKAYIAPRKLTDKDLEKDKEWYTLILLAENFDGYRNLMKLSSIGHLDGFFNGKPRLDKETLKTYADGIIALSGDIQGEVQQLLKANKIEDAKKTAKEYEEIFGKNDFYLELQDHPAIEGQIDVNTKLIALSEATGIPKVVTRDVHYLHQDDAEAQDVLRCISGGLRVDMGNREDFRHVDRSLNTAEDIMSRFRHVPDAIENTVKIAERVNIEIELDQWHFAPVDLPPNKTSDETLRDEAFACAPHFYPEMGDEITDRIEYELEIIKEKGYSPYFICVADYVRYAKDNGIVESTRGSAAGSLVSYVLGITTVDPIRFKLPFERFLNPFRPSPPDVDTDFADDRRDDMIAYVTKKYGADKVAQIITFGTMAARAAVRDVGRALGLSYSFCDQVAKLIPQGAQGFPMTIERALKEEPDLKKLFDSNDDVHRLLTLAQKVEGCARHTSIHAAGVVISPTPLVDFTPVQRESGGDRILTQYSMYDVEAAGVLKNDFLGIRNLSILGKAVEIVQKTTGEEVDIYHLPLDDTKTFDMISRGETMGVFQFGSSGMIRWIKELRPTNIDDIMAMVALYRPGPMDFIPEYIKRAHDPSTIDYPHPDLEETLEKSLGLLIYQDDVMLTAIKLAGYDWLEADKFRKAMGKKIPELMKEQEKKFKDGCIANHHPRELVNDLWERIKPFATYAFNKAHAASYGIVAYQTAYMKANYPVQYMTAILQAEASDIEKVAAIVHEGSRMGITVLPPDVNESFKNFAMTSKAGEPGKIRFGLTAIKNVGEHICDMIYRERKEHGQYTSLENFLERVTDKDLNKKSLESLIQAGALDCFHQDRGVLLANIENILFYSKHQKEQGVTNQGSLFAGTTISLDDSVVLKDAPVATMDDKLLWEKTLLGIYVSSHPFAKYEHLFRNALTAMSDIEHVQRDEWVITGGVIDAAQKKITKKGGVMMFVTIQDNTGSMEYLVFPKTFEKTKDMWVVGNVVVVVGKTPREEGDNKIFVENVYLLTPENAASVAGQVSLGTHVERAAKKEAEKYVTIPVSKEQLKNSAGALKELFAAHPGDARVYFEVEGQSVRTETFVHEGEALEQAISGLLEIR
ncbi:MAG: polymerase III, alpha subunit protein [Candidatus Magasanikbacteria bacterium GW2011_GWD2_43_18]|nr:MAG: polymerase III, alpha subunit protein [Candidatus Magasanikbacteria bacterium GW2011_GWC2_42_27]KKT03795.1 MAG: polymerase III, alpha subunit protein [Candidatus Magasanikbacteria bacterium GW2011_GWD2_43_18]KKT25501.1 MAG: polymerase III, alpha subunit protein [Candidatus Magasanikbacteria bacterium GW2011_GWA2_43_9]HBB38443.1 DNA polymerase III subunit alpha [Candidatus Magasanikbacteria bacterium]HCC14209.1 DNA polymerase III subunit alpha [Candidatus Magasanikbacteria bacterium]